MDISLTPELEKFIEDMIKTGRYKSQNDIISEGLRRLKQRDDFLAKDASLIQEKAKSDT